MADGVAYVYVDSIGNVRGYHFKAGVPEVYITVGNISAKGEYNLPSPVPLPCHGSLHGDVLRAVLR